MKILNDKFSFLTIFAFCGILSVALNIILSNKYVDQIKSEKDFKIGNEIYNCKKIKEDKK